MNGRKATKIRVNPPDPCHPRSHYSYERRSRPNPKLPKKSKIKNPEISFFAVQLIAKMKTTRIILKVPFYKHPAGTVFDLSEETTPANWSDDTRVREKQSFHEQEYYLPDGGRGFGVSLSRYDTVPCPEHVFEGEDLRKGPARVTLAATKNTDANKSDQENPPCGRLREEDVSIQINDAVQSQGFLIKLPPFEDIAEKMVLFDRLEERMILEYELRNYKHTDTELTWDVSDLYPGFFDLEIRFPGGWYHVVRFIKFFPRYIDPANISPAPKKEWQKAAEKILSNFPGFGEPSEPVAPQPEPGVPMPGDLRNEALDLCLEWGEMFNQPTQERMMQRHPDLPRDAADELDRLAREVRSFVYDLCQQEYEGKLTEQDLPAAAKRKYPWLNSTNTSRMISVGMFYARK